MKRIWAILFLLVPILGCATFVAGYFYRIWLPVDVSEHGRAIDHLFMFILWLTGFVFVGTEVALFWFLWRYDERVHDQPARFTHGDHNLEVVWTLLPAATLLFIAIYQMDTWASEKMRPPQIPPTAEVMARQFAWGIRYPGPDGHLHTADDVHHDTDLHVPLGEDVLLVVKSADVLHSFFVPSLRVKQDVVPGMKQHVWFKAKEAGEYDIVCAELCGWGHYKMKGKVTVEPRDKFDAWMQQTQQDQWATHEPSEEGDGG